MIATAARRRCAPGAEDPVRVVSVPQGPGWGPARGEQRRAGAHGVGERGQRKRGPAPATPEPSKCGLAARSVGLAETNLGRCVLRLGRRELLPGRGIELLDEVLARERRCL
jgi:hypothetical protein